jgi:hypothetical protein
VTCWQSLTMIVDPAAKIAPPWLDASMVIPALAVPTLPVMVNAPE